jgi:hypothetical protein
MLDLIERLRGMVGDPNTGDPTLAAFTDEEIQAFLDERRTAVYEAALGAVPSTVSGAIVYRLHVAPRRWWESDAVLTDGTGTVLVPDTIDAANGQWTFDAGVTGPVYITGHYFDLYGSAAAVCDSWAAKVAREFDFATDQQKFDRTGKREGLMAVAREFWRKAVKPGTQPSWRASDW